MSLKIKVPQLWEDLREKLYTKTNLNERILLVGGSVRDVLRNELSKDLDLVVEKKGGALLVANELAKVLGAAASNVHAMGQAYPIYQLMWQHSKYGSIEIQIADTQKEMFMDPDSRQRVSEFALLEEDCLRRDFTCNMLYYDLKSQTLLDPSGCGVQDIANGFLRGHPEVSLNKIFKDDPLRMLRLLRFWARFDWSIEQRTWQALLEEFDRVSILSQERVRDEIIKISQTGKFADVLAKLMDSRLMEKIFPEFLPMNSCTQDPKYHSEGNVWVHTLAVMRNAPSRIDLQLAALLHDVGKPDTWEKRGDSISFINHEKVSRDIADLWLQKWKFAKPLRQKVLLLVELHLRGGDVSLWKSLKPARKLLRDAGESIEDLITLIEADSKSSLGPDGKARTAHIDLLKKAILEAQKIPSAPRQVISGKVLMESLGLSQGPEIAKWKKQAEDIYEEALLQNRVLSEEDLIKLIKKILS